MELERRGRSRPKAKQPTRGTPHLPQLERLKKIEGQVRGIARMVEDQRYCIDILVQIKAIMAGMRAIETNIIEEHLKHCVSRAISLGDEAESERMIKEVTTLLKTSNR